MILEQTTDFLLDGCFLILLFILFLPFPLSLFSRFLIHLVSSIALYR